ncbi:hypothetical protein EJP67_18440 [Variovorax guangxiensis]|uniref:Uncharacterized protein n=1 Tax=Variovorax guangxiensis TaxID=1775474 RepID=A0A433MNH8_9BURK|nr:hypothetical protein [Variovorax guangxiensis]RUR69040.1 hypothetical protein EJP67_18440 [Variovorax guangxiensis]
MKPYPFTPTDADFRMPTSDEIAEADERQDIERANGCFRTLGLLFIAVLLIALGVHFHFRG